MTLGEAKPGEQALKGMVKAMKTKEDFANSFRRLKIVKEFIGVNRDQEALRFCITFAYRQLIEKEEDRNVRTNDNKT